MLVGYKQYLYYIVLLEFLKVKFLFITKIYIKFTNYFLFKLLSAL